MLYAEALIELAGDEWKFSDEPPSNWKECVATYLTAWVSNFNPQALLELGDLLVKTRYRSEAKETFRVLLLFPTYAEIYFAGQQTPDLVNSIVSSAKDSLRELA